MQTIKKSRENLNKIVKFLNNGGVAVCPTDTVYGFLALAENKKSIAQSEALYTLGVYYMMQNDVEQAKNYFSKIVEDKNQDLFDSSLWVNEAKEKLASL